MTDSPVLQLRLVAETDDFDAALAFYRDVLGLPESESYEGEDGARVAILSVASATLEIANREQVRMIDRVEVGRSVSRAPELSIRVAFEVTDAEATTRALVAGGRICLPRRRRPRGTRSTLGSKLRVACRSPHSRSWARASAFSARPCDRRSRAPGCAGRIRPPSR